MYCQQAHGNFFELLDAGMGFFFKHLSLSGEIKGFKREEHLDVPAAALREALINALCHRDYDIYQCSIGIAIYDNRIEIESPGLLPRELTPKTIKRSHRSYPRNEVLATVLYQTTYLEKWGSGIKRIMDACKAEGSPPPFWSEEGGYTVVTFQFLREPKRESVLAGGRIRKCHIPFQGLSLADNCYRCYEMGGNRRLNDSS